MAGKLTAKQQRFVDEYLIDLNGTRAYKVAYPNVKKDTTAAASASQLLANPKVAVAVQVAIEARSARTKVTQDRVLKEFARLAFLDPRELFKLDGSLKPIHELHPDVAACVGGIDVVMVGGSESPVELKKIKLIDKKGALDSVARHLGMFNDKVEHSVKNGGVLVAPAAVTKEGWANAAKLNQDALKSDDGE